MQEEWGGGSVPPTEKSQPTVRYFPAPHKGSLTTLLRRLASGVLLHQEAEGSLAFRQHLTDPCLYAPI